MGETLQPVATGFSKSLRVESAIFASGLQAAGEYCGLKSAYDAGNTTP